MSWLIVVDGGSRGNPGPAASGFVVLQNDKVVFEAGFYWGIKTNNQAEYLGLLMVLGWIKKNIDKLDGSEVVIRMDSELVVSQVNGVYKVKSAKMKPLYDKVKKMIKELGGGGVNIKIEHQLRQATEEADRIVNEVLDLVLC